jgi:hypothetical protein
MCSRNIGTTSWVRYIRGTIQFLDQRHRNSQQIDEARNNLKRLYCAPESHRQRLDKIGLQHIYLTNKSAQQRIAMPLRMLAQNHSGIPET